MERDWGALIEDLKREGILRTPNVIKAMLIVPRAKFLPEDMKPYSASDTPLPIGFGQTVSAPHGFSILLSQAKHGCNNE